MTYLRPQRPNQVNTHHGTPSHRSKGDRDAGQESTDVTRSMGPGARIKMDERDTGSETSCQYARPTEPADNTKFTQDQGSESKSSTSTQNALHDDSNSPLSLIVCGCGLPFADEHGHICDSAVGENGCKDFNLPSLHTQSCSFQGACHSDEGHRR